MNMHELETVWAPRVLSILRIVAALIFMEHGTQKLFGFPPSDRPAPELFSLIGLAGVLEFVGGVLLVLGLFTRPVAFILSGEMAFAYWMAHAPQSFFPVLNGGDAAILYCFVFLYLAVAGGGAWSLDNVLRERRRPQPTPASARSLRNAERLIADQARGCADATCLERLTPGAMATNAVCCAQPSMAARDSAARASSPGSATAIRGRPTDRASALDPVHRHDFRMRIAASSGSRSRPAASRGGTARQGGPASALSWPPTMTEWS